MVFEFVVAAMIFFTIILYTINYLNSSVSAFSNELYINNMETRAIQISELLIHNPGVWDGDEPRLVGLCEEWPVLNSIRIGNLHTFCQDPANYNNLLQNLGLEENRFGSTQRYNISIRINESGNPVALLDCGPSPPERRMVNVERFALSGENKILSINVWLW
jgi:hypothetical protein